MLFWIQDLDFLSMLRHRRCDACEEVDGVWLLEPFQRVTLLKLIHGQGVAAEMHAHTHFDFGWVVSSWQIYAPEDENLIAQADYFDELVDILGG